MKLKNRFPKALLALTLVLAILVTGFGKPGFLLPLFQGGSRTGAESSSSTENSVSGRTDSGEESTIETDLPGSAAFSIQPVEGITISAEENALDRDRSFTMKEVEEKEWDALAETVQAEVDPFGVVMGVWDLDAGLSDEDVLPGVFEMEFDLAALGVEPDEYDGIAIYRIDDDGNWTQYAAEREGSRLRVASAHNSTILMVCLALMPLLPDIGTTLQGIMSGAVYDIRSKSFWVKVDGRTTFQFLVDQIALAEIMQNVNEQQQEECRVKAREQAKEAYRKEMGVSEKDADLLEYSGKRFYRIYLDCLKQQLANHKVLNAYKEDLEQYKKNPDMLAKDLEPVKYAMEASVTAYKYLRDEVKVKLPTDVIRVEISGKDRPAYGATIKSYDTIFRNHYIVLYALKFAAATQLDIEKLTLTMVHELFHIVQREYKSVYTANYAYDEMTAQVVEWEAFDYFTENGTLTNDKETLMDNLERVEFFAIPLDKLSVKAYPDGALELGDADSADVSYPRAAFIKYLREQQTDTWDDIMRGYGRWSGRKTVTANLKNGFLLTDSLLTDYFLDYAEHDQVRLAARARGVGEGYAPRTKMKENGKVSVSLVNRDYVIRARLLVFNTEDRNKTFAVVLKKSENFDEVMTDFRIIPAGLEKDQAWKEWDKGIFIEPKTHKRYKNGAQIAYTFLEADGGTAEATEGYFSDTKVGYDLYMMMQPDVPKWSVDKTVLSVEPIKPRTGDTLEFADSVILTIRLGKTEVLQEQIMYKNWDKAWTYDLKSLRIDGKPLTEEQLGGLTLVVQECVAGTYKTKDPCLGPESDPVPLGKIEEESQESKPEPQAGIEWEHLYINSESRLVPQDQSTFRFHSDENKPTGVKVQIDKEGNVTITLSALKHEYVTAEGVKYTAWRDEMTLTGTVSGREETDFDTRKQILLTGDLSGPSTWTIHRRYDYPPSGDVWTDYTQTDFTYNGGGSGSNGDAGFRIRYYDDFSMIEIILNVPYVSYQEHKYTQNIDKEGKVTWNPESTYEFTGEQSYLIILDNPKE